MIIVRVKYSVKPGTRDTMMEAARTYMAHTWTEKGCVYYDHLPSTLNDTDIIVVEKWETKEDLVAHLQAPEFEAFRSTLALYEDDVPLVLEVYEATEITL